MRLFRASIWCPSGGGGTREARGTVVESLVVLYQVSTHQIRRGRRAARSLRARGVLNPCARESKARTGTFLREKLISDHCLFSYYEGQQGAANRQDSWAFFRDTQSLGGWMLARALASPASPAQGLLHHRSRYFNFSHFCMTCAALRNLDLLIKTDRSTIFPLCC